MYYKLFMFTRNKLTILIKVTITFFKLPTLHVLLCYLQGKMKAFVLFLIIALAYVAVAKFNFGLWRNILMMQEKCQLCDLCNVSRVLCTTICAKTDIGECSFCRFNFHCNSTCLDMCPMFGFF